MAIKKVLAIILALLFIIPAFSAEAAADTAEPLPVYDVQRGDFDGDGMISADDAVYLLYNSLNGDFKYPINHSGDFNGNGAVDCDDAIYLLYSYMFGQEEYSLPEIEGHLFVLPCRYYQYNSLTDTEKEAYDRIKEAVYSYNNTVDLLDLNIEYNRALVIFKCFVADNPQCFWIAQRYGASYIPVNEDYWLMASLKLFYCDGEVTDELDTADRDKINAQRAEVDAEIERVVALIDPEWSDFQKEFFIHDYLVDGMQYNTEVLNDRYADSNNHVLKPAWNIYGAFVDKSGVCEAYAEAFQTLCYAVGIQCNRVTGPGHVWNTVLIDDDWYMIDVTWDDPIYTVDGERVPYKRYDFFNLTEEQMVSTGGHMAVDDPIDWFVPECNTVFDRTLLSQ